LVLALSFSSPFAEEGGACCIFFVILHAKPAALVSPGHGFPLLAAIGNWTLRITLFDEAPLRVPA